MKYDPEVIPVLFLALNVNHHHESHTNTHLPLQPFCFFLHPIISHLRFGGSGYKIRFGACSRVVCWFLQQLTSEPDKQKHVTYRTYMTVQVCAPMRVSSCHNHEGMAAFTHTALRLSGSRSCHCSIHMHAYICNVC